MCWCDQPEIILAASHGLHFAPTHVAGWRWYSCPWFPMTSAWSGTTGILSESWYKWIWNEFGFRSGSRQNIPPSTFLCAGWEEGAKDACGGDSGGPLVFYRPDGRAELVSFVVTSFWILKEGILLLLGGYSELGYWMWHERQAWSLHQVPTHISQW